MPNQDKWARLMLAWERNTIELIDENFNFKTSGHQMIDNRRVQIRN